jgi:hypothetical protein
MDISILTLWNILTNVIFHTFTVVPSLRSSDVFLYAENLLGQNPTQFQKTSANHCHYILLPLPLCFSVYLAKYC